MTDTFKGEKRLTDQVYVQIDCTEEFSLWDPNDQITSVVWSVEDGDVTVDDPSNTINSCKTRVSGGTKLYSWHSVRATITCVSGQVYTPLIEIQLVR